MKLMQRGLVLGMLLISLTCQAYAFTRGEAHITTRTGEVVTFNVEFAITPQERAQGLMGRDKLGPYEGMVFIFPKEALRRFWMKDTKLPLDILFFDKDLTLISVFEGAEPYSLDSISSLIPAQYVLEIPAGTMENFGLAIGNQMRLFQEK